MQRNSRGTIQGSARLCVFGKEQGGKANVSLRPLPRVGDLSPGSVSLGVMRE